MTENDSLSIISYPMNILMALINLSVWSIIFRTPHCFVFSNIWEIVTAKIFFNELMNTLCMSKQTPKKSSS
ncbi:hypothetical protein RhiirA1_125976 [Rhizophagus irregularis]|uniref:Uncharacterized protein n=1 Tax=Rhizophagus irregularis TaxID=588596 RepID=A0A2N0SI29_9GLOM|nr:hypothetical protein RhiirA1_125976 [Rhizophagus irregularis]